MGGKLLYSIACAGLLLVLSWPSLAGATRIKCWTNAEGTRECGDVVPPEHAQKSRQELNERGIVVERINRAKTAEEIQRERERQAKLAAERAEKKRQQQAQAARDRILLATFTSEQDLVLARDGKLEAIEAQIRHTERRLEKLEKSIQALQGRAADFERRGKPVPDWIREDISTAERQILENRDFIRRSQAEQAQVRARFEKDIERFQTLMQDGQQSLQ